MTTKTNNAIADKPACPNCGGKILAHKLKHHLEFCKPARSEGGTSQWYYKNMNGRHFIFDGRGIKVFSFENEETARLIVSAPDLLKQRDQLRDALEGLLAVAWPNEDDTKSRTSIAIKNARAALAATKGEA